MTPKFIDATIPRTLSVKTTVVAFEDSDNPSPGSSRFIDGEDKITVKQTYRYSDGQTKSVSSTLTLDQFLERNNQSASSTGGGPVLISRDGEMDYLPSVVELNPRLAEDIKKVAQGRYRDPKMDFRSLKDKFFAGLTKATNNRGLKIELGKEYYLTSGEKVRVDVIRMNQSIRNPYILAYVTKGSTKIPLDLWVHIDSLHQSFTNVAQAINRQGVKIELNKEYYTSWGKKVKIVAIQENPDDPPGTSYRAKTNIRSDDWIDINLFYQDRPLSPDEARLASSRALAMAHQCLLQRYDQDLEEFKTSREPVLTIHRPAQMEMSEMIKYYLSKGIPRENLKPTGMYSHPFGLTELDIIRTAAWPPASKK